MPKYLVYGDEPFLIDKFRKKLSSKVKIPEMNLLDTDVFEEEEQRFLSQYPMFGDKKILIYRAKSLKECTEILEYLSTKGNSTDVYFFPQSVDKRSKAYKMFKKEEIVLHNKLAQDVLDRTIQQFIKKVGCEINTDAYRLLLELLNYYSEETNLYDVQHALDRICGSKTITKDIVESTVMDHGTENIFHLIHLIMRKQYKEMYRQADLILRGQSNNVIGVLSLLLRSYRLSYKMQSCNCSLKALNVSYNTFVPKLTATEANQAMNIIDQAIMKIKSGYYSAEIAFKITLAKLCCLKKEEHES